MYNEEKNNILSSEENIIYNNFQKINQGNKNCNNQGNFQDILKWFFNMATFYHIKLEE